MIKLKAHPKNAITRDTVEQNPAMDHLGYHIHDRETTISHYLNVNRRIFGVLEEFPRYDVKIKATPGLLAFHSSHVVPDITVNHPQLHYILRPISESVVIYSSYNSLNSFDLTTRKKTEHPQLPFCENIALHPGRDMVGAAIDHRKWVLYSLGQRRVLMRRYFDELVNCSCFIDPETVLIGGNFPQVYLTDIEAGKNKQIIEASANVNLIEHSPQHQLLGLALDDVRVQMYDLRSSNCSLFLEGHRDYNFAVKFLSGFQVATGSQDLTTRIWDIRQPQQQLHLLPSRSFAVSALDFSPQTQQLYALESIGYLNVYAIEGGSVVHQWFSYPSVMTGISLSPSQEKLFLGLRRGVLVDFSGIVVFNANARSK